MYLIGVNSCDISDLTRVSASCVVASTHEDVRDELVSAGSQEHVLALVVAHNGHRHL